MRNRWFAPLCILIAFALGLAVYSRLPQAVPSHWDLSGKVDGTMGPLGAVLFLPGLSVALWLLDRKIIM